MAFIPDKESTVYCALYICLKGSLAKLEEHEAGRRRRVNVQVERLKAAKSSMRQRSKRMKSRLKRG